MRRSCTVSSINPRICVLPSTLFAASFSIFFNIVTGVLIVIGSLMNPMALVHGQGIDQEPMEMSVVVVNPSKTKVQTVPIKMYLPQEVTPDAVLDPAGLSIEYDADKAMYYVYKEEVLLQPSETKVFNVEIKDVWIIPQERLDSLNQQAQSVIVRLEGSEFYDSAVQLGAAIKKALDVISTTQADQAVSKRTHIGIYRNNQKIYNQVKEDVNRLEKQLEIVLSMPKPEVLEELDVKTKTPSESASWMIIFIIMLFIGMLAGVFFFTWHTQANTSKNLISEARDSSFPGRDKPEEKKE